MTYDIAIDGNNHRLNSIERKVAGHAASMDAKSKSTPCWRGPMYFLSASAIRLTK